MRLAWCALAVCFFLSAPRASAGAMEDAVAAFKKNCSGSPKVVVDTAALKKTYNPNGWLRDDGTATNTCAERIAALAERCGSMRAQVWSQVDASFMDGYGVTATVDLRPLAAIKEVRCTLPSNYPALAALVAQHPEWSEGDKWTNAIRMHLEKDSGWVTPEVTLNNGVLTFGYFDATMNIDNTTDDAVDILVDLEAANVLSGGSIADRGRFALVELYAQRELKRFNKECGAAADLDIDWADLAKAWPGWTTWKGKCGDNVCEYVAAIGFVNRVVSNLADTCAGDADEKFAALKKVKHIKLVADPRGVAIMQAWKKKPKKKPSDVARELYPDVPYVRPSFSWKGDTLTYGMWLEVVNAESATEWLTAGELAKHE